jgi:hypothetical protein
MDPCSSFPQTTNARWKTYKYMSFWIVFTQLLFLLSIRLASSGSCHIIFNSLHFFCSLEVSTNHNAIQRRLPRHRSPCLRLFGHVGRNHLLRRGGLHWLGHRQHRSRGWSLCLPHQWRFWKVNWLFWCPQFNRFLPVWRWPRYLYQWRGPDAWWWLWMWNCA